MNRALRLAARETLKRGYDGFTVLAVTPEPMKATYVDTWLQPGASTRPRRRAEYVPGVRAGHRHAPRRAAARGRSGPDARGARGSRRALALWTPPSG